MKLTGFRQKLTNGSETQMEEEDALAVGYEVVFLFRLWGRVLSFQQLLFQLNSSFHLRMVSGINPTMTVAAATSGWWPTPSPSLATTIANKNIFSSKGSCCTIKTVQMDIVKWVDGLSTLPGSFGADIQWICTFWSALSKFTKISCPSILQKTLFMKELCKCMHERCLQGNQWVRHWPSCGRHQPGEASQSALPE